MRSDKEDALNIGGRLELFIDDCEPIIGDSIEHVVAWKRGYDVGDQAGKPVRLRLEMKDSDVFSFRFR